MKAIAGVVFLIGAASFGALAWMAHGFLDRSLDTGAIMVAVVFAAFGSFCLYIAWRAFQTREDVQAPPPGEGAPAPRRIGISHACASAGVVLLVASALIPEQWYPVAFLFTGLALLCVSHVLTPCVERLEKLRQARESMRQL